MWSRQHPVRFVDVMQALPSIYTMEFDNHVVLAWMIKDVLHRDVDHPSSPSK